MKGYNDQGRWSDKRAAAYKAVCAQAILRDRRKAEVNAQKREVKAKAKAKPTPTRKSKSTRKAGAKRGANGKASAGQTASMPGIDAYNKRKKFGGKVKVKKMESSPRPQPVLFMHSQEP